MKIRDRLWLPVIVILGVTIGVIVGSQYGPAIADLFSDVLPH